MEPHPSTQDAEAGRVSRLDELAELLQWSNSEIERFRVWFDQWQADNDITGMLEELVHSIDITQALEQVTECSLTLFEPESENSEKLATHSRKQPD